MNKRSASSETISEIQKLIGVKVRQEHLFIEETYYSNMRLKLKVLRKKERLELQREPASYFYANVLLTFLVVCIGLFFSLQGTNDFFQMCLVSVIIASTGYGITYWANSCAERENPLLIIDLHKRRLRIPAMQVTLGIEELHCLMAIRSIPRLANKPESSHGELKLLFTADSQTQSLILTGDTSGWVKAYDEEIRPLADALKVPLLHVERSIADGNFKVQIAS